MSQGKIPPETTTLDDISKFFMKFGHLILEKIIKFVDPRRQILRQKCIKFDFRPTERAYSALQTP